MNEISSSQLYEGLLTYGMFNEKLPPFLTGKPFFDYCQTQNINFPKQPMQYSYYESMRNINIPRPFGIPNPAAYQRLCSCLAKNWDEIKQYFKTYTNEQSHKISRIHIRKMNNSNALFEMNYSNFKTDGTPEPSLLIGNRYLVCADISNCFPSMYTHSLPWALVGKQIAKQTRKDTSKWYNEIDFYTRNIKDGETHGLLIGPHTSNLLSEIILVAIDKNLYNDGWHYIRNIDDYKCYVDSYEDGQAFLVKLSEQLRSYDLTLNHKKTEIVELPIASVEKWVRKLNSFSGFDISDIVNLNIVRSYIDYSIELMQNNKNNSAIRVDP